MPHRASHELRVLTIADEIKVFQADINDDSRRSRFAGKVSRTAFVLTAAFEIYPVTGTSPPGDLLPFLCERNLLDSTSFVRVDESVGTRSVF